MLRCRAHAILAIEILKTKTILDHFSSGTENAACLQPQGGRIDPALQSRQIVTKSGSDYLATWLALPYLGSIWGPGEV